MATADDPLERLAVREMKAREQRAALQSGRSMMKLALRFFAGLAIAWAIVLAAHWVFFCPVWLVLADTLGFLLVTGYWAAAALFMRIMRKRVPEWFDS